MINQIFKMTLRGKLRLHPSSRMTAFACVAWWRQRAYVHYWSNTNTVSWLLKRIHWPFS